MLPLPEAKVLWLDGSLVPWDAGKVHLRSTTVQFGFGAFEGIRAFEQANGGSAVFRLDDHVERLFQSLSTAAIEIPYDREAIARACVEVVAANGLRDAYLRPFVYVSEPFVSLAYWLNKPRVSVMAWPWGGPTDGSKEKGIKAKISPFTRPKSHASFFKAKLSGHYLVSTAALADAVRSGYGQGIFLDEDGFVCESTTDNIFMVKDGAIWTPTPERPILMGWTRATVLELAEELGVDAAERDFDARDLMRADEVFTTGTSSGMTPLVSIDDRPVGGGSPGPITRRLQAALDAATRGTDRHHHWRRPVA
jgi:branched-chain amino acid aminotransferase